MHGAADGIGVHRRAAGQIGRSSFHGARRVTTTSTTFRPATAEHAHVGTHHQSTPNATRIPWHQAVNLAAPPPCRAGGIPVAQPVGILHDVHHYEPAGALQHQHDVPPVQQQLKNALVGSTRHRTARAARCATKPTQAPSCCIHGRKAIVDSPTPQRTRNMQQTPAARRLQAPGRRHGTTAVVVWLWLLPLPPPPGVTHNAGPHPSASPPLTHCTAPPSLGHPLPRPPAPRRTRTHTHVPPGVHR